MEAPKSGIIGLLPAVARPFALRARSYVSCLPRTGHLPWITDLWPGDAERGKHIANRRFTLAGCDITFSRQTGWYAKEATLPWLRALHGFGWMRDVCAYHDPRQSAKRLRFFVEDWLNARATLHPAADEPAVAGERLATWIVYALHITRGSHPAFQRRFLRYLLGMALQLRRQIARGEQGAHHCLPAIKGVLLASVLLPGCGFMFDHARMRLDYFLAELRDLLHHPEHRNPAYLHEILRHVIDIQDAYRQILGAEDETLGTVIAELAALVAWLRQGDGGFSLFNGAVEGDAAAITRTLAHESVQRYVSPVTDMFQRSGFARLEAGKSLVVMDAVAPDYTSPAAYFGTLGFEWSYGDSRVVVNCGAFLGEEPTWQRVVRTTAAHSTLCLDNRNSCQFTHAIPSPNPFTGGEAEPHVEVSEARQDGYLFVEAVYNGYVPYAGLKHARQVLINEEGTRFSGADHLLPTAHFGEIRTHHVNIRFHLHPDVKARRLMNGVIVLHIPGEAREWTFQTTLGQAAELEESVYLGRGGKPAACQQIVIHAPYHPELHRQPGSDWLIEWSFIAS